MSDLTFRQQLAKHVRNGKSPEDAYAAAVKAVTKDELARYFRPVGVNEARHIRRMDSRSVENRVFGGWGSKLEAEEQPERPPMDLRGMLAHETFKGVENEVTWEAATREDHVARVSAQEELASKILADADRHRRAVKLLDESGAETLSEVEDWSPLFDGDEGEPDS